MGYLPGFSRYDGCELVVYSADVSRCSGRGQGGVAGVEAEVVALEHTAVRSSPRARNLNLPFLLSRKVKARSRSLVDGELDA